MHSLAPTRIRAGATLVVALAIWSLLLWQQANGKVPSHSFMARADMPSISNWWGALVLPVLTWFLTGRAQRRLAAIGADGASMRHEWMRTVVGFTAALLYGAALATAFTTKHDDISFYLFGALPVISFLVPIYRAQYVLGFVLGMSYTFGAVLPTFIATVLSVIGVVAYTVVRPSRWPGRSR